MTPPPDAAPASVGRPAQVWRRIARRRYCRAIAMQLPLQRDSARVLAQSGVSTTCPQDSCTHPANGAFHRPRSAVRALWQPNRTCAAHYSLGLRGTKLNTFYLPQNDNCARLGHPAHPHAIGGEACLLPSASSVLPSWSPFSVDVPELSSTKNVKACIRQR